MKRALQKNGSFALILRALTVLVPGMLIYPGIRLGLSALMNRMFDIWGVTQDNILRAPVWIRLISGYWNEWVCAAQGIAAWALARLLCRAAGGGKLRRGAGAFGGLTAGACAALLLASALWALDALRMGRRLQDAGWSLELLIPVGMYFLTALGSEALLRGALRQSLAPYPEWLTKALGAIAFAALTLPAFDAVTVVNYLLLGLLLEEISRKTDGYLAGAALRFSLSVMLYTILGCKGGAGPALYEMYPAALDLLSGVNLGPMSGLMATGGLIAALAARYLRGRHNGVRRAPGEEKKT